MEEIQNLFVSASNSKDAEKLVALFADDGQIIADPWGKNPHGKDEILAFLKEMLPPLTIKHSIPSIKDNQIRIWTELTGAPFPKTTPLEYVIDVNDGKITSLDMIDMTP